MKLLVTGGCGYVGSLLVQKLLLRGYEVIVVDTQCFGNYLTAHPKLEVIREDIRNAHIIPLAGVNAIIHLASVANDPCVDLDPALSWEVNVLATLQLAEHAVRSGVKHFIYASSGSVYGISDEPHVTEDIPLYPLSAYNKTKMTAERVLMSYSNSLILQIVRPGTVCGVSPRMRLDLLVNMLAIQALTKGEMTIMGGAQQRPAIHIDDITDVYLFFLDHPGITGIFNASFENLTVSDVANLIAQRIPARMSILPSNDIRSYRMSSQKLIKAGFHPRKNVEDAINEIVQSYREGRIHPSDQCYNIKWMKRLLSEK